jgi:hypothetical protein
MPLGWMQDFSEPRFFLGKDVKTCFLYAAILNPRNLFEKKS